MTSATPKPRAGEHTSERALEELAVIETCDRALLIHSLPAYTSLAAQNRELTNMLAWHVNHEGECLGDHPELLEVARALLAKHGR